MRTRLTALAIEKLRFPEMGQVKYWDELTPGFGVLVSQRTKSFIVMYGKERRLETLGKFPSKSLQDARKEAKVILATHSPKGPSRRFADARTAYLDECRGRNRPNTVRQYTHFLNQLDFSGDVSEITRADLAPFLSDPHPLMAFKVFFNWCIRNDLIDRNPIIGERAIYNFRSRVLTKEELKAVWHYEDAPFTDIVKLLILTGQRRNEIASIHPTWINGSTINFPASITKNKRDHTIPYGPLTAQFLKPCSFNGWSKSKARLDQHVKLPAWVLHDLRRSFATIHAQLGTPIHITEKILNHVSGTHGGIVGVYQRHTYFKEMKAAVETYEAHIAKLVAT